MDERDGLAYKYIDLAGGKRPWLLNRVENGLGKTTEVSYTTSTAEMLEAEAAGSQWTKLCPTVLHMVDRVTVRDNLGNVGRPDGEYVTEYTYRDPYFDGMQREFRGFSETTVRTVGDANSPTSESRTEFLLGESPYTEKADRWRDNPNEALKGLPTVLRRRAVATCICRRQRRHTRSESSTTASTVAGFTWHSRSRRTAGSMTRRAFRAMSRW